MAARFLLDTNICIYIRQKKPAEVLARFRRLESGDAVISVITQGELLYGAQRSLYRERALESLRELAEFVPVLPLPEEAATAYGEIRASLEKCGQSIGNNDLWIAAHAVATDLILVTNNEWEFRRVPGLRIQNWAVGLKAGRA